MDLISYYFDVSFAYQIVNLSVIARVSVVQWPNYSPIGAELELLLSDQLKKISPLYFQFIVQKI